MDISAEAYLDAQGKRDDEQYDLSVLIPLYDEEESLPELLAWIDRVVGAEGLKTEILLVDDGSQDASWSIVCNATCEHCRVRGIRFQRNYGKSAALQEGFRHVRGRVVCTMDADLQDSPDELPELYRMITEEGYDLVSGWKRVRHDPKLTKNLPSKLFNATARCVTGVKLHDFNCGLKAYRSDVVKSIELFGDMHRYIPALARSAGFRRIGEKVVRHYPRKYGRTKYGLSRFANGFLDLLTVAFISKFGKRPMHFFGLLGTFMFLIGGGIAIWLIARKLISMYSFEAYRQVTEQPLFFLALMLIILGVQFFLAGFLGELLVRSAPDRNRYNVAERLD